jgi:methenyltetrahydrofolate cyclohydrolase
MTTVWDLTLAEFRWKTASHEPVPGGGSVAMVSASLGMALVIMALEITLRNPKTRPPHGNAERLLARAKAHLAVLGEHPDADIDAFNAYMTALRLPKRNPTEAKERAFAMQQALHLATSRPLAAARDAIAGLDLALEIANSVTSHLMSDVGAGATLLGGAVSAVLLNVDINVTHIDDMGLAAAWKEHRTVLERDARHRVGVISDIVQTVIASGN